MTDRQEITIRTFQLDDLPALVDVINRAADVDQESGHTTLEQLRDRFATPYFNPQDNCLIALTSDGRIIGYATAELDPRVGRGWGSGCIHPDARRQGIGTRLLWAAEVRHLARGETEVAPDLSLVVSRYCRDTNTGSMALLEGAGYVVVRISWFMYVDLAESLTESSLPAGITLRPFVRERDSFEVCQAEQAFFRNNWGYLEPPFDMWEHLNFTESYDPSLWLVAMAPDGETIAGLCRSHLPSADRPGVGWVESLAVGEDFRGHGLGKALLQRGFRALRESGCNAAALEVDSENKTNAVALYERAGMHPERRYLIFRKVLRGDPDALYT